MKLPSLTDGMMVSAERTKQSKTKTHPLQEKNRGDQDRSLTGSKDTKLTCNTHTHTHIPVGTGTPK